jgi:flagellar basal-body rod modification protein FlgD
MAVGAVDSPSTVSYTGPASVWEGVKTKSKSASDAASVDYNSFLKLLIAQMKNQDPTDPMDASEQIAQLATFSQVEQTIQTNKNLESLIAGTALGTASGYVGKTLTNGEGTISGVVASVKVYSDAMVATTVDGKEIVIAQGVTIK